MGAVKPVNYRKRKQWLIGITLTILLLGLLWFLVWLFYFRFHESTDDAYVNGNMVYVTPVISGIPIAFFADDTDYVQKGEPLVLLDKTEYQFNYENALSQLASTVLRLRQVYNQVKIREIQVKNKQIVLEQAKYNFENRQRLIKTQAISNEEFTQYKNNYATAELEANNAVAELQIAKDAVGNSDLEHHPLLAEQKAKLREAFYRLEHCTILAPISGYIAKRSVQLGQAVAVNTPLMAIISNQDIWIDANFKETQLANIRIGQLAEVTFDIYGSEKFEGKVVGVNMGSGSVFSLIPPQNATGNWIKIVQRLPVRIAINSKKLVEFPLRLGLSTNVNINISNINLPKLAQNIQKQPIAETNVFQIDLKKNRSSHRTGDPRQFNKTALDEK